MNHASFSRRISANGTAPSMVERNIRALYQELEDLRDNYCKAIVHQIMIFDYVAPEESSFPIPEGIIAVPPADQQKRTTMRAILCDISSLLLSEMTSLAKSFEAMNFIDSPGQIPLGAMSSLSSEDSPHTSRRNTQFSLSAKSASASGLSERQNARMSMPVFKQGEGVISGSSTPIHRSTTPVGSQLAQPPTTFDDIASRSPLDGPNPKKAFPNATQDPVMAEGTRPASQDRVAVQGFGPGGLNDKFRVKGKGRVSIVLGSLYLQAGLWSSALTHCIEGATIAKSVNDYVWHGKALELISVALILLGHHKLEFLVPPVLLPQAEKGEKTVLLPEPTITEPNQYKWLKTLQVILPGLVERIIGLYSKSITERLPPLAMSEAIIRLTRMLAALHTTDGLLSEESMSMMVYGTQPSYQFSTSPRTMVTPSRQLVTTLLLKALPAQMGELLSTLDRTIILASIAAVFGSIGYHRKKALVIRELLSVLTTGLVEARTRGAADVGIHPAAGLVALDAANGHTNGAGTLELNEGDIEFGLDRFLGLLCRTYGIVGPYTRWKDPEAKSPEMDDSDEAIISRIQKQSATRFYGIQGLKINILRACISFSEALPDFSGVLRFSSDLLRTAGSGIAPGSRKEDASAIIPNEEQVRLAINISKTYNLSRKLGLDHLSAEYWDEFLVRGVVLEPRPAARMPVLHFRAELQKASRERASQDVNPFIYNPFLQEDKATIEAPLVTGEVAFFKISVQNPYDVNIDIESLKLDTTGVEFESAIESAVIGPYRTQLVKVGGIAKAAGALKVTGAIVRVRGCRERRFPIFSTRWAPRRIEKTKALGIQILDRNIADISAASGPKPSTLDLNVIAEQPVLAIKATTLPQASAMILEGERQTFSITFENLSTSTPADFLLFSFEDSTQGPLQAALKSRDASPIELYEYELILAKKQALRLKNQPQSRHIPPGETAIFEFEILGKPGLTSGTVQVDYGFLGVSHEDAPEKFYTRQVRFDIHVTVNASVEIGRVDVIPLSETIPRPLWTTMGGLAKSNDLITPEKYCLLMMDLRNAWPSQIEVRLDIGDGLSIDEQILPGNTSRVIFPIKRVYLDDPHASIPVLNPHRQRQFVVSTSQISPGAERANREAFWYRERILDSLSGMWKTRSGPEKSGKVDLRSIKLTNRMIEVIKIEDVDIAIFVESIDNLASKDERLEADKPYRVFVDEFIQIRTRLTNRSLSPIYPTLRIMPALCHRPLNVALDFTRKWAWNGTLQQHLPLLQAGETRDIILSAMALCRGEFEITASVEETMVYRTAADEEKERTGRTRRDTQSLMDAMIGPKERRIWSSRTPAHVLVTDRPE